MNGISLRGETHKEVVSLLKELPLQVCLVCSHPVPPPNQSEEDEEEDLQLSLKELLNEFNEMVSSCFLYHLQNGSSTNNLRDLAGCLFPLMTLTARIGE